MNYKGFVRPLIIGLALFSMFFGSGNLIFPLAVGRFSQDNFWFGALGFILTGVLVPFAGVIAMVIYKGDYMKFFSGLGKKAGFGVAILLLTFWIPLGSAPRCVTLSYAAVKTYLGGTPLWLFSLIYCSLIILLTYKRNRILDILGGILTPVLLTCLGIVIFRAVQLSTGFGVSLHSGAETFTEGLLDGYNTMDLIASFFFASTIIAMLNEEQDRGKKITTKGGPLGLALRSSLIGVSVLGVVYLGLLFIAATHASALAGVPKDELLPTLAHMLLGPQLAAIASMAVAVACLTTSIALVVVYADFLAESVFKDKWHPHAYLVLTTAITFGVSNLGFQGICALTVPAFQVFYPFLIGMIIVKVGYRLWKAKKGIQPLVS